MNSSRKNLLRAILILVCVSVLTSCGKAVITIPRASKGSSDEGDKAEWQSQSPSDGDHVEAGSEFDITWFMTNIGTTTWTPGYSMRYFAGTDLTKPGKARFGLTETVAPGETGTFNVDALAPWKPGTYQMFVVLSNEHDENFSKVDITIVVDETEE